MAWLANVAKSFRHAGRGFWLAARDRNLRIMLLGGIVVVALASAYDVSTASWAILLLCIGVVLGAEVINTAIERLADQVQREHDANIRDIKDLVAGAALVSCVVAAAVGAIVLWPYVTK